MDTKSINRDVLRAKLNRLAVMSPSPVAAANDENEEPIDDYIVEQLSPVVENAVDTISQPFVDLAPSQRVKSPTSPVSTMQTAHETTPTPLSRNIPSRMDILAKLKGKSLHSPAPHFEQSPCATTEADSDDDITSPITECSPQLVPIPSPLNSENIASSPVESQPELETETETIGTPVMVTPVVMPSPITLPLPNLTSKPVKIALPLQTKKRRYLSLSSLKTRLIKRLDDTGFPISVSDYWPDTEEIPTLSLDKHCPSVLATLARREMCGGKGPWIGQRTVSGWPLVTSYGYGIGSLVVSVTRQPSITLCHYEGSPVIFTRFLNDMLITASLNGFVCVWSVGGDLKWSHDAKTQVTCATIVNDLVVVCTLLGNCIWLDIAKGTVICETHVSDTALLSVSSGSSMVALGSHDGHLTLIDSREPSAILPTIPLSHPITSLCFMSDTVLACGLKGSVCVVRIDTMATAYQLDVTSTTAPVDCIAWNNGCVTVGCRDGVMSRWKGETLVSTHKQHVTPVLSSGKVAPCRFACSDRIYVPDKHRFMAVYDIRSSFVQYFNLGSVNPCISLDKSRDMLITGHVNGGVAMWKV